MKEQQSRLVMLHNSNSSCFTRLEYRAVYQQMQSCNVSCVKAAWNITSSICPRDWPADGVIEFKNYSTRYRPGLELVLKNITCTIQSGEKVTVLSINSV